jgi:hypothetical protein
MVFLMVSTWCLKHVEDTKNWFKTLIFKVCFCWFTLNNKICMLIVDGFRIWTFITLSVFIVTKCSLGIWIIVYCVHCSLRYVGSTKKRKYWKSLLVIIDSDFWRNVLTSGYYPIVLWISLSSLLEVCWIPLSQNVLGGLRVQASTFCCYSSLYVIYVPVN